MSPCFSVNGLRVPSRNIHEWFACAAGERAQRGGIEAQYRGRKALNVILAALRNNRLVELPKFSASHMLGNITWLAHPTEHAPRCKYYVPTVSKLISKAKILDLYESR